MPRKMTRKSPKKRKARSAAKAPADPIRHVVLLMLENRSFDQMLGDLQSLFPRELEGVDRANPRANLDAAGGVYEQAETDIREMKLDPMHEAENVRRQLATGNGGVAGAV